MGTTSTSKQVKVIVALLLTFALVSFGVIVVNQTFQLVSLAARFGPVVASVVFWSLMALYALCLGVPIFMIATLPSALRPPSSSEGPLFEAHLNRLRKRLARNPNVVGKPQSLEEIEAALQTLDKIADAKTKAAASQVFMSTAISQNGSLDAVIVLAAQGKLVLEIARVYYQRPAVGDLIYLYTNVAATAFVAAELGDIDLSEQVQPVITATLGSTIGAIPGFSAAATIFANSVTTGAGDAFLTLRVGLITKQYCRALVKPARKGIRHTAAVQALGMLGGIAREGAANVVKAMLSGPMKYAISKAGAAREGISNMVETAGDMSDAARERMGNIAEVAGDRISLMADAAGDGISSLIEATGDGFSNMSQVVKAKSADAVDAVKRKKMFKRKGVVAELPEAGSIDQVNGSD